MKESLTSSNILNICHQIENSMTKRWKAPLMEAYIAFYLDPRFKSMSFDKEKKKEVQEMIAEMIKTNTIDTPEQTEIDQFFDGDNQSDYPLDNELERHGNIKSGLPGRKGRNGISARKMQNSLKGHNDSG
ncbi:15763_t:CDS:2 [Dentiscutata erythropus]|uniref:15763_t:CDS:1 n=1 Tax=Dentiscutata erythropus TaxID=1348616 RepID=A0A9N9A4D6_9GLOM|nr:15763_t:CDS:2 [Dentiscutata erythropus]